MYAQNQNEDEIFRIAHAISDPQMREAYLNQVCGHDHNLHQQIAELLAIDAEGDSFLENRPPGVTATLDLPLRENAGDQIDSYKLLQQIGEGGFGVVFMAQQTKPVRRKVALKIIKPGMDTKEVVARFEAERQTLAIMDHPNIAKVLDGGSTKSGRPYFVMELVNGVNITEYADTNNLSTKDRLNLFVAICRAVHHAHQKGVIHRDLKPNNVLVTLHDGRPVPKVIDFGVSKAMSQPLTERTMFTRYGQVIGTPQYMSPEQAELSGLDVDTRSDVYSLGVILYELLTGRTPFLIEQIRQAGLDEMLRLIREYEPLRPSNAIQTLDAESATAVASHRSSRPDTLSRTFKGDLDWIVMKALEKDRGRRYDSANRFAEDIERHLHDEAVEARPPSIGYKLAKTYRRNRLACISGTIVAITICFAIGVLAFALQRSRMQSERIRVAQRREEQQRLAAESFAEKATEEANISKQTLEVFLDLLSKTQINPRTGDYYTVPEALSELAGVSDVDDQRAEHASDKETLRSRSVNRPPRVESNLHLAMGKAYSSVEAFELAEKHFNLALQASRRLKQPDALLTAKCLKRLGYESLRPELIEQAIELERDKGVSSSLAVSLTLLGKLQWMLKKADNARRNLTEACRLFEPIDPTISLLEIPHLPLSHLHRKFGNASDADRYEKRAVEIAISLFGDRRMDWLSRGKAAINMNRREEGEYALLVANQLSTFDKHDDPAFHLAEYYDRSTSDVERAEWFYRLSLQRAGKRGATSSEAGIAAKLGKLLFEQNQLDESFGMLSNAIELSLDVDSVVSAKQAIETMLVLQHEHAGTEAYLQELRQQMEKAYAEHSSRIIVATNLLAAFELYDGDLERAENLMKDPKVSPINNDKIVTLLRRRGQIDESLRYYDQAIAFWKDRSEVAYCWRIISKSRSFYQIGDFENAEELLRQARHLSTQITPINKFLHYWVSLELATLHDAWGERGEQNHLLYEEVETGMRESIASGDKIYDKQYDAVVRWRAELGAGKTDRF